MQAPHDTAQKWPADAAAAAAAAEKQESTDRRCWVILRQEAIDVTV
jgi:hypothetical protein